MRHYFLFSAAAISIAAVFFSIGKHSSQKQGDASSITDTDVTADQRDYVDTSSTKPIPIAKLPQPESIEKQILPEILKELPPPLLPPQSDSESEAYKKWQFEQARKLHSLSKRSDRDALLQLLGESQSTSKLVRETALSTLVEIHNREAIPYLESLSEQTQDNGLKEHYSETIRLLKMQTFSEYREKKKAEAAKANQ